MAIAAAAPAPGFIGQPILARYAPAPEAPANTAHATHLARLAPVAYAAGPAYYAPQAYAAPAYYAPQAYAAPAFYAASPIAYNAGYHVCIMYIVYFLTYFFLIIQFFYLLM